MVDNTTYMRISCGLKQKLMKIRRHNEEIESLAKLLGTSKDSADMRERLTNLQKSTKKDVTQGYQMLTQLQKDAEEWDPGVTYELESLQQQFTELANRFLTVQGSLKDAEDKSLVRTKAAAKRDSDAMGPFTDLGLGHGSVSGTDNVPPRYQQRLSVMEIDIDQQAILERERELEELANDINEISDLFNQLGEMVEQQGASVDSIADNVNSAHAEMESGVDNLHKAVGYKRSARRKKLIIALIILAILAVIAGVLGLIFGLKS